MALPTETVYGLAANGLDPEAIRRIFHAKKRPLNNPLILHTDSLKKVFELFDIKNSVHQKRIETLAEAFWPGPLTMIAQKAPHVPLEATGNLPTVGVRMPRHDVSLAVMSQLDFPLAMPSANRSTRPSPTTAEHVFKTLDGSIDAVVDGGSCAVGIESTIVQVDSEQATIVRLGMITQAMLEACLLEPVMDRTHESHERPLAPGNAYLHYSPQVASVKLMSIHDAHLGWHKADIMLIRNEDFAALLSEFGPRPSCAVTKIMSDEPENYAHELYGSLYACEAMPERNLLLIAPPAEARWQPILDRLSRAVH